MASIEDAIAVRFDTSCLRAEIERLLAELGALDEAAQLEALIPSMRQSAQSTLAALHRSGFRIVKEARS